MYLFTANLCIYSQPIYVFFHSQFMYLFTAHLLNIQVTLTVDAVIFYRVFEPVRAACLLQVFHICIYTYIYIYVDQYLFWRVATRNFEVNKYLLKSSVFIYFCGAGHIYCLYRLIEIICYTRGNLDWHCRKLVSQIYSTFIVLIVIMLFSVVILFQCGFPELEIFERVTFIFPRGFGRVPHDGAGRPSLDLLGTLHWYF